MNSGKNDIGVIGLAAMGSNLAMNFADHGFRTAVYNRSPERTEALISEYGSGKGLDPTYTLESFVASLERPRKIILMVQAGEATDAVVGQLLLILEKSDIVIDGGNSFFKDTVRRERECAERDIRFVGMGISGGEEGARRGPSLMPGGTEDTFDELRPFLEKIAARDFSGKPCVAHIGGNGAGHYVKMVHNGIEYADMQFIAETYALMHDGLGLGNERIADAFSRWNEGRLESYLVEITAEILRVKEQDGGFVVDRILDSAGGKGTGKWTAEETLELGVPSFSLVSAVLARYASAHKEDRLRLSEKYPKGKARPDLDLPDIERALYAAKLFSYAQGYGLLVEASKSYGWNLDFSEISRIWQGGCIIRARFLADLEEACSDASAASHLLLSPLAEKVVNDDLPSLRSVASAALSAGIAVPGLLSALSFFDSMTTDRLPANLIQAQRDYFGAHGFQRNVDGPAEHFDW